jgi:hypothetical protein
MSLPTDDKARKSLPIFDGVLLYFPDAIAAVAEVSRIGNDQHNPGQPLHWARGKSMDQMNTALRHMLDHGTGTRYDKDGARHLAKTAWRILAQLQLDIEAERNVKAINEAAQCNPYLEVRGAGTVLPDRGQISRASGLVDVAQRTEIGATSYTGQSPPEARG